MEESIPFYLLLTILLCTSLLLTTILRPQRPTNLPPGPPPLPIIGNFLQLGKTPHRNLAQLAKTYGPIMHLKLGYRDAVVVSSAELAKQVLQKHDQFLSGRLVTAAISVCNHAEASMVWSSPANPKWRTLRRIVKEHMFSQQRMDSSQGLRQQKLKKLRDYVQECSESGRVLDITDAVFTTSLNLMSTSLFSKDFGHFHSEQSQELMGIVHGILSAVGTPNLADYIMVLKHFDLQGLKRKMTSYMKKLFSIFDDIIDGRLKSASVDSNDFLEELLKISTRNESELSRNDILHLLLNFLVAGVDTTSATIEWAMAELLHNPEEMVKARNELHAVIGKDQEVQESDISRLPYLQAIVKETFRLHPAAPFLVPHKAEAETQINGFVIPREALILVNVWSLGTDPKIWPNPDCFSPGRFLGSKMDVRGQDFELIPFGSGRRMCPGLPLAHQMVHLMVASLIQGFDWSLEGGNKPEEMDMNDKFMASLQKAVSLKANPVRI